MLTQLFKRTNKISVITSFAWVGLGAATIVWQVFQLQKEFPALTTEANNIPQLNPQKLDEALSYFKEDQLTSSAPSDTLKTDSASQSGQIDEIEKGGE